MCEVLARESIVLDADKAAQRAVAHGVNQPNPHPLDTEAHALWKSAYEASLVRHSAEALS